MLPRKFCDVVNKIFNRVKRQSVVKSPNSHAADVSAENNVSYER